MAEKKKDPWHKDSIEDTLKTRASDKTNLMNVIEAMDAQLRTEVTKILKKHTGKGVPNWSLLDSEHKDYNKKAADEVRAVIDKVYAVDSELHPLADVIQKANLKGNYFNEKLIQGLYFGHVETLKQTVDSKDYMKVMKKLHEKNAEDISNKTFQQMFADVDPERHGDYVLDFIRDKYKVDSKKVNEDQMRRDAGQLLADHHQKQLSKDSIHLKYKILKKQDKAA